MEDLKFKIFQLINNKGYAGKIPVITSSSVYKTENEQLVTNVEDETDINSKNVEQTLADQEVLDSILPEYMDDNFDPIRFELKKLPEVLNGDSIKRDLSRLTTQQSVVSNQVLKLILDKTTICEEEFERIVSVKELLGETVESVRVARHDLGLAHRHFTTASLGILANYRKRTLVQDLLRSLNTIKTLERTEARLQELLAESDFPGAISLLLECQAAATTYRHFNCVAALSGKLQDTLVMAEEQLDVALANMCCGFEEPVYSKLQAAYALLGKTRIAMDQLLMHFTSAIHNSAFNVVHDYAQQDNSTKKQYGELCKCVAETDLIPCLVALCQSMWKIILSYHQISSWHHTNYTSSTTASTVGDFESTFNEPYVKQKLKNGLDRLWHDVQTRVSSLVLAANLIHFKVDDFLQVLAVLYRLEQIGKEFTGKESEELQNSVRKQSIVYFRRYHAARLDELRIFLENEAWTVCPVQPDFTLLHLQEFKGLRYSVQQCAGISSRSNAGSLDGSCAGGGYFSRFSFSSTPFDSTLDTTDPKENILNELTDDPSGYFSEDSEDESPELQDPTSSVPPAYNKSSKQDVGCNHPLLTNTTLTVLRHCGKYLQMSKLLRFIAADVIVCLVQLFEYYLFSVYSFFTTDLPEYPIENPSSIKLQAVLKRIKENLILVQNPDEMVDDADQGKVSQANISPEVELNNVDTIYGLPVRVVAVESLVFLADQFNFLRAYLEQLLDTSKHILTTFYVETVSVAMKVRYPVYSCVAWRSVNTQQALALMGRVNWEVNDVMSEHSPYVDSLFRELQIFSMRLTQIDESFVHLEQEVLDNLWENIVHLLSFILVEGNDSNHQISELLNYWSVAEMKIKFDWGLISDHMTMIDDQKDCVAQRFSLSKRCSNGGRALMQLDFTQLFSQVEKLCTLRPLPYREFVDTYVKAYYLTEPALETFIKEHKEYSTRQLLALISCVCQGNKKSKQRLSTMLEEWQKLGMR